MSQLPEVHVCQEPALPSASGRPASMAAGTACTACSGVCNTPRQAGHTASATAAAGAETALLAADFSSALLAAMTSAGGSVDAACKEAALFAAGGCC